MGNEKIKIEVVKSNEEGGIMNNQSVNVAEVKPKEVKHKMEPINISGSISEPTTNIRKTVAMSSKYVDFMNEKGVSAIELSVDKRDLADYVSRNMDIESRVDFVEVGMNEFVNSLSARAGASRQVGAMTPDRNEIYEIARLFYPSSKFTSDSAQGVKGLFNVSINRDNVKREREDDLLGMSVLDDVESLFTNSNIKKFTLDGYRQIYSTNTYTNEVNISVPVITVILAYFGFEVAPAIDKYYISMVETSNTITIRIRK